MIEGRLHRFSQPFSFGSCLTEGRERERASSLSVCLLHSPFPSLPRDAHVLTPRPTHASHAQTGHCRDRDDFGSPRLPSGKRRVVPVRRVPRGQPSSDHLHAPHRCDHLPRLPAELQALGNHASRAHAQRSSSFPSCRSCGPLMKLREHNNRKRR